MEKNRPWTDVDRRLADVMSSYWVNFAATGDPNGPGLPSWPAFETNAANRVMIFGDAVAAGSGPTAAALDFYDRLYGAAASPATR